MMGKIGLPMGKSETSKRLWDSGSVMDGRINSLDVAPNVEIWQTSSPGGARLNAGAKPRLLANLSSASGVTWSSPVYLDPETGLRQVVSNEVIVALSPEFDPAAFFVTNSFSSYRPLWGTHDQFVVSLSVGGELALKKANELHEQPGVRWATPNLFMEVERLSTPNDTLFTNQWHLNNTAQTGAQSGADAKLTSAWDTTTGSSEIVIAIFDDGVQTNHPDLAANIFVNPYEIAGNGIDDDSNGWIDDVNGLNLSDGTNSDNTATNNPNPTDAIDNHGTAVAGVAAAVGNNSLGVAGAAYTSKIMPIKFITGNFFNVADLSQAIYYAAGRTKDGLGTWRGADIGNHSYSVGSSTAITNAFDWAATNGRGGLGMANFVATGNSASGFGKFRLTGITTGNWQFEWRYVKDGSVSSGNDTVWLANVGLPNGTVERFNSLGLPTGWTTSGNANWSVVDDPAHSYGTGRYVAKAGTISHSQSTAIRSPVIAVSGSQEISYQAWVSSESGFDFLKFFYSFNGGAFTEFTSFSKSGIPATTTTASYPASLSTTIAVGASTDWDYRSDYSQYGSALDFVAPSSGGFAGITTTDRTGTAGYNTSSGSAGDYDSGFGGTSSASPLAVGIGALLLSKNPNLTDDQLRQFMRNSANQIGGVTYTAGFNTFYGYGRVNANAALGLVTGARRTLRERLNEVQDG